MPGLVAMFETAEHCNVKPEKRTACNLYQGYAGSLPDELAQWLKQYEWARTIKVGDMLTIKPLYNGTTGNSRYRVPTPCEVLAIDYAQRSQTDVMVYVATTDGSRGWLDAGWFYED